MKDIVPKHMLFVSLNAIMIKYAKVTVLETMLIAVKVSSSLIHNFLWLKYCDQNSKSLECPCNANCEDCDNCENPICNCRDWKEQDDWKSCTDSK